MKKNYHENQINGNYYVIKKKQFADAINFVTGMRYLVWDSDKDPSKKVYSFEVTPEFLIAFEKLNELKNQLTQM